MKFTGRFDSQRGSLDELTPILSSLVGDRRPHNWVLRCLRPSTVPEKEERFEARDWLKSNPNPSALASNRFGYTEKALEFVEGLYASGAVGVYVTDLYDEDWRINEEGGPYADTLIVQLPADPQRRAELFNIVNTEAVSEGFGPERDTGQSELTLWWD